jgi:hypothetical protein
MSKVPRGCVVLCGHGTRGALPVDLMLGELDAATCVDDLDADNGAALAERVIVCGFRHFGCPFPVAVGYTAKHFTTVAVLARVKNFPSKKTCHEAERVMSRMKVKPCFVIVMSVSPVCVADDPM